VQEHRDGDGMRPSDLSGTQRWVDG